MKFTNAKGDLVMLTWRDHAPACPKCRDVRLDDSSSFVTACAQGSALLAEHLKAAAAPSQREKMKAEEEWAKKTGAFAEFDRAKPALVQSVTRYKE